MIKLEKINVVYDEIVFQDASIELYENQINIIKGKSGSGKTTLLSILGFLQKCRDVNYEFDDKIICYENDGYFYRKYEIGYVFQENYVLKKLTVEENIRFFRSLSGKEHNEKYFNKICKLTSINHLKKRNIDSLSGGERQRVAIACALIKNPRLLLLDEPTSFLDSKNAYLIMMVLEKIVEKTDTIVLLATHDQRIMKKEYVNFCIDDKKIVKDKICDNKINNLNENEKPDFYLTQKAYKKYAKITQRKNSYLNCIFLTFMFMLFFFLVGYHNYYNDYITNNFINAPLEEVRVYYGKNKPQPINEIYKSLDLTTLNKIKQVEGIKKLVPIYELQAECQLENVLVQSYSKISQEKIYKKLDKQGVYISYNLSKIIKNGKIMVNINGKDYNLTVAGILSKNKQNEYSNNGEKIIYVNENEIKKMISSVDNPFLYVIVFDGNINLKTVKEKISKIDKNLVYFCTKDINQICILNDQLLDGVNFLMKISVLFLFIIIIYDKQKFMKERESEFALLYTNGMNVKEFHRILFIDTYSYEIFSLILGNVFSFFMLGILYGLNCKMMYTIAFWNLLFLLIIIPIYRFLEIYNFKELNFKKIF